MDLFLNTPLKVADSLQEEICYKNETFSKIPIVEVMCLGLNEL